MAVTITVEEVPSVVVVDGETKYRLDWEVTAVTDIDDALFLLDAKSHEFQRVVRAGELDYPTTPTPSSSAYYRSVTAYVEYDDVEDANTAKSTVEDDIESLQTNYQAALDTFLGTRSYTKP